MDLLWTDNSWFGRIIILLILVAGFYALRQSVRGRGGLRRELHWLDQVRDRLRVELARQDDESMETVRAEDLLLPGAENSLVHQRVYTIDRLQARSIKVQLPTLQSLTTTELDRRSELGISARVAQIAMILGILGTFLGLAILVQDIQFAVPDGEPMNPESWRQSLDGIARVMVGIKTAFSTSLVGMGTALLLTIESHRVTELRNRLLNELETLTVRDLLPNLAPDFEDSSLLDRVSRRLEMTFESLESAFERNDQALEELSGVHEAYVEILDQVQASNPTRAGKGFAEVVDGLAAANEAILKVADSLPRAVRSLEMSQRRFSERLQELTPPLPNAGPFWLSSTGALRWMIGALVITAILYFFDWL